MKLDRAQLELVSTIIDFAKESREKYKNTKEWTHTEVSSCMTIRVPVALLNRIRELEGELLRNV